MKFYSRSFISVSFALLVTTPVFAGDTWYTYQGNANHDGYVDFQVQPRRVFKLWEYNVGTRFSPIAAAVNQVFLTTDGSKTITEPGKPKLLSLDAKSGNVLWTYNIKEINLPVSFPFSLVSAPAFENNKLYFVRANRENDSQIWEVDIQNPDQATSLPILSQWDSYFAPTPYAGNIYFNSGTYGGISAVDPTTSLNLLWWQRLNNYNSWSPALDENNLYVYMGSNSSPHNDAGLTVMDRQTGTVRFFIKDPGFTWSGWSMNGSPVLTTSKNIVVINHEGIDNDGGNRVGTLKYFDLETQMLAWEVKRDFSGQPSYSENIIYAVSKGHLVAIDETSGHIFWEWSAGPTSSLQSNIVITKNHIIVGDSTKTYILTKNTHALVKTINESGSLAASQGKLFIQKSQSISAYSLL